MRRTAGWIGAMWMGAAACVWGADAPGEGREGGGLKLLEMAKKKAEVRFWGQVNRAALFADNGTESEWFHVDNDSSPSRFGMAGDLKPESWKDWAFGGQIELGFKSDNSGEVVFGGPDPEFDVDGRKIEAFVKSKRFGSLWAGQGDTASNGTAEEDLSGTGVIGYSQVRFAAASLVFGPAANGPAVKKVFNNFDGLHRDDRIRYDTPVWHGLTASVSAAGEECFDAALRHSKEFGPHKVSSAVACARKGAGVDRYDGSRSVLLGGGLNVAAAIGGQNVEGEMSPRSCHGKAGWKLDLFLRSDPGGRGPFPERKGRAGGRSGGVLCDPLESARGSDLLGDPCGRSPMRPRPRRRGE